MVLGAISHMLALSTDELIAVLLSFTIDQKSLPTFDSLQAAVQELDVPRVEVFVMLFACCADRMTVCSPEVLYDLEMFPPASIKQIWKRLGRLRTFDAMNCCQAVHSNLGYRHELNLTKYEDHRLMEFLLRIGCVEDGENMINCFYSEVNYLSAKLANDKEVRYDFLIPATWIKEIPHK